MTHDDNNDSPGAHVSAHSIGRFVDGDGSDLERDRMRAHVRSCSACAGLLARTARLDDDERALEDALALCPSCERASPRAEPRCGYCGVAFAPGGYRVERVVHESDHGRLYVARSDDDGGALVALKEVVFARLPNLDALRRFERETELLRQLRHPRIPQYLASFSEGEGVHLRLYLAQRYVDGASLLDELAAKRFSEAEVWALAREVLEILAHLQQLSPPVLHRDVKPANLVRGKNGALSLVDFGSARDVDHTVGGTLVGTFGYMPVEQLTGIVDESTDIYALGATLVHVLTRRPPWESPRVDASPRLRALIDRMMAPREKRFANARTALAALDARPRPRTGVVVTSVAAGVIALACAVAAPLALAHLFNDARASELASTPPIPPIPPVPSVPPIPPVPPLAPLPPLTPFLPSPAPVLLERSVCEPIDELDALVAPGRVLLLGELFGTQEVPAFVGAAVCHAASLARHTVVALDIPDQEQPRLDAFLASSGDDGAKAALLGGEFWTSRDGRSSTAMLGLLERIRAWRATGVAIDVVAVEPSAGGPREDQMEQHILDARARDPNASVVVLVGNVQSRLTMGYGDRAHYEPLGYLLRERLRDDVVALDVAYARGTAYNDIGQGGRVNDVGPSNMIDDDSEQPRPFTISLFPGVHGPHDGNYFVGALHASMPATTP
ncbi:MAG TPA: protein kinase [Myxococcota bacterium]